MSKLDLSIIIPTKDEEGSLNILCEELHEVLKELNKTYEIIIVDDGSSDDTFEIIKKLHQKDSKIKAIQLRGNFGKSVALSIGFSKASGEIIFTLDGDLQDNPKEIPNFLSKLDAGYDLVSGWKKKRLDPSIAKVIPSRIINYLTRKLTGLPIHDTNCGFKAYRREVIENLNLYGELYRFIPVIAFKQNFRVGEVIVEHRIRKYGKTKFGWTRGIKGILDLLTIVFITGYQGRPGHFFGTLGIGSFFLGFLIGLYITYLRVTTGGIQYRQPLLFLGMLMMIIGIQLISTGLLAEMVLFARGKPDYSASIKEIL
ncbi:MAG: glycosyltransferase family 2 protein [Candidatus Daviesbacteria bacterium]|nr:glycosyltransferase family 2 protein [Candidatus Daviesbacteria bacterium]